MRRAAGLLAAAALAAGCGRAPRPTVVLISVDTLRADHLPAYGYRGVQTPAIDALAKEGLVFENAYSQVPLTLPSHAVILTGQPPYANGVRDNLGFRLAPTVPTIGSMLRGAGYAAGAAVSSLALAADRGLAAGFDSYDDRFTADSPDERAGSATASALEKWIDGAAAGDRPLFLFLHLYEPHAPYAPPPPFRERYAAHPYDGEIAAADAALGGFLEHLKKRGLFDGALVLFLSDHGEGLGDHGEDEHGVFLYREAVRVPLVVKLPRGRRAGERVKRPVGLIDVLPTIAAALRIAPPPEARGVDLLGAAAKGEAPRRIYSETLYPRLALGWSELYALSDDRYQYVEAPRPELYDFASDPGERLDLASGTPDPFRAMRAALAKVPRVAAEPRKESPEDVAKLGALGYINVARGAAGAALPDPKDRIASLRDYKKLFELFYAKKDAEVVAAAKRILGTEPGMVSVWRMSATARERTGDFRGAARDLESALAHCPDASAEQRGRIVEELADALVKSGDPPTAENVLREGLAGPLANDAMRLALARLLSESGRASEAAAILPPASSTDTAAVADARGVAAAESGRLDDARREFLAALAREPGNTAALVHLGMLALREKDPAAAADWFRKAVASDAGSADAFFGLGLTQVQAGDANGAHESWSKAIALNPSHYDALYNLALLAGRLGRRDEARRALDRFVATAPPDRYAGQIREARRLLKSLGGG